MKLTITFSGVKLHAMTASVRISIVSTEHLLIYWESKCVGIFVVKMKHPKLLKSMESYFEV